MFRRGFTSEALAARQEKLAKERFGKTDLSADGSALVRYVIPFLADGSCTHWTSAPSTTCTGT